MPILNKEFYARLDSAIDTLPTREEAEKFINSTFTAIQEQATQMYTKVWTPIEEKLNPYLAYFQIIQNLASPPASLDAVLSYLSTVASAYTAYFKVIKAELAPYIKMYNNAQEFLGEIPTEVSKLQNHLKDKIAEKGWDLTVPDISYPTIPPLPPIPPIIGGE